MYYRMVTLDLILIFLFIIEPNNAIPHYRQGTLSSSTSYCNTILYGHPSSIFLFLYSQKTNVACLIFNNNCQFITVIPSNIQ